MRSRKIIKNVGASLILQMTTIICGFIIPRLIIGSYGSAVNGLISSITKFLGYITLLESGFGPVIKAALYKPIANRNKQEIENILKSSEKFFRKIATIFLIYMIILCIIYPQILNNQFDTIFTVSLIIILSISTFAEYFFGLTYKLYLQAEQKAYVSSYIDIITTILNAICVVILIKLNFSIQIVKLVTVSVYLIRPILQNIYVKRKYRIDLKNASKKYEIKQKWDALAQHIASVIHSNTDIAVLTIFSNVKEISVYSVYLLVVNGIRSLSLSFSNGVDASWGDMIAKEERDNLNKKFNIYKLFYDTIITIIFICTAVLIVPFVKVYTKGITDVDYVRPVFGTIMVLAEFVWIIRQPYNDLIKAAGHFKETQLGAWIEAISNIVISIILVNKFGLVGVAIGTLIAMIIRMIDFIFHSSKYILYVNPISQFMKLLVIIAEITIVITIFNIIPGFKIDTYIDWVIYAVIVLPTTTLIVCSINICIYRDKMKDVYKSLKNRVAVKKSNK